MTDQLLPLPKLIARLRTDLKLAGLGDGLPANYTPRVARVNPSVARKNILKASALHYLEELQTLKNIS